jgi:peptide chain release factor 2
MCGGSFDRENKTRQLNELQTLIDDPGFWSDQERSTRVLQQRARLEETLNIDKKISSQLEDAQALVDLGREGEEVESELTSALQELESFADKVETQVLLSGVNDRVNAILEIHPGAGGTESQDWAEMLMRMYLRWAERSGYKTQILDYQSGDEAGIKSATINIIGEYAYGMLASETGVHRLVRISPFDSAKRRHTSFASVAIYPELDDKIEVGYRYEGSAHRYVPIFRKRRTACEHNGLCSPNHTSAHGIRDAVPERKVAAQEQGSLYEGASSPAV